MSLKQRAIQKEVNKNLTQKRVQKPMAINSIGVLFIEDQVNIEGLRQSLVKQFKLNNEAINCLSFAEQSKTENEGVFTKKSFSLLGKLKKQSAAQPFLEKKYDLLINYFNQDRPELLLVSSRVKTTLRIGFQLDEKRLNDLDVLVQLDEHELFIQELVKYLKILK